VIERPTYLLALRPAPSCRIPDAIALRKVLKILLRSFGLRCIAVSEAPPPAPAADRSPACETGEAAGNVETPP